jgi:hypothetical protein
VNYPGDFPPSPEERAALSLAVNAAWLARAKAGGHTQSEAAAPGVWEAAAEKMMERDNAAALAAARRDIAIERKAQKCYICGRRDLPRWARRYGLAAAGLFALPSFAPTAHAMLAREFVSFLTTSARWRSEQHWPPGCTRPSSRTTKRNSESGSTSSHTADHGRLRYRFQAWRRRMPAPRRAPVGLPSRARARPPSPARRRPRRRFWRRASRSPRSPAAVRPWDYDRREEEHLKHDEPGDRDVLRRPGSLCVCASALVRPLRAHLLAQRGHVLLRETKLGDRCGAFLVHLGPLRLERLHLGAQLRRSRSASTGSSYSLPRTIRPNRPLTLK